MKQVFCHYKTWEDFNNGMYSLQTESLEQHSIMAYKVLSNCSVFMDACKSLTTDWPVCTSVNLTNKQCNRRAWLGAAACNYLHGCTEVSVRVAWGKLTELQQQEANAVANQIINTYEGKHGKELFD
jgi:hypothetical protein